MTVERSAAKTVSGRVVGRQSEAVLALQQVNVRQLADFTGQVAANGADYPRELLWGIELRIRNRTAGLTAIGATQGEQNGTVWARLGDYVVLRKEAGEFFLEEFHLATPWQFQWAGCTKEVAVSVPSFTKNKKPYKSVTYQTKQFFTFVQTAWCGYGEYAFCVIAITLHAAVKPLTSFCPLIPSSPLIH
jgi:hypothetical protein